jgi:hypothetical protein
MVEIKKDLRSEPPKSPELRAKTRTTYIAGPAKIPELF